MDVDTVNENGQLEGAAAEGPRAASAPFNKPAADVIMRSSDQIDFHVRRAILSDSEVSSVLESMFNLPQPTSDSTSADGRTRVHATVYTDGYPVIVLQEDASTLDALLRICYPLSRQPFTTIDALSPVLAAATKYVMDDIVLILRGELRNLAKTFPLRTYCVAVQYQFPGEAAHAARATLDISRRTLYDAIATIPELKLIDGRATLSLLEYRERCVVALVNLPLLIPFLTSHQFGFAYSPSHQCECPPADALVYFQDGEVATPTQWWLDYMRSVVNALKRKPTAEVVQRDTEYLYTAFEQIAQCAECREYRLDSMRDYTTKLATYVENKVSEVKFSLPL